MRVRMARSSRSLARDTDTTRRHSAATRRAASVLNHQRCQIGGRIVNENPAAVPLTTPSGVHGSRLEPVAARRQVGVDDVSLLRRVAPVRVTTLEPDLITKTIGRPETWRSEIDFERIAVPRQLEELQLGLPKRGDRLLLTGDAHRGDEDGGRDCRRILGGTILTRPVV